MTDITPDQLAEWERLAEAATEGPWHTDAEIIWNVGYHVQCCGQDGPACCGNPEYIAEQRQLGQANETDAAFIARVRELEDELQRSNNTVALLSGLNETAEKETARLTAGWHNANVEALFLRASNKAMAEALKPFAAIEPSSFYAKDGSEGDRYTVFLYDTEPSQANFTGVDLARAREALRALTQSQEAPSND